jgi:glycosyltransferase involved in cell wall biosynthesis
MPKRLSGLISVVVSTYDWPEALTLVLEGLANQTDKNFEVIVADDGSDRRTAEVIAAARVKPVHVWREHQGFRLAEIRNRAILASKGEYVIFLDGDCIPRRNFVAEHRRMAEPGCAVQGDRMMVRQKLTQRILTEKLSAGNWSLLTWCMHRLHKRVNRIAPMITLPLGPLRMRTRQTGENAVGCNQAIWRRDLDKIDGFDASFIGWGWEDSDVLARLLHAGVKRKYGRYATGVIHLYHDFFLTKVNRRLLDDTLACARVRARQGMSALAHSARVDAAPVDAALAASALVDSEQPLELVK